ncbi:MAG: hypothetical protein JWM05_1803 [Acidimicrobiales bacterium]|nr:hypothetical protein [Acidimicrobiales bacterium]
MTEASSGHLRNRPRQARSAARIEQILDAAATVFSDVGYDAATTNLVAKRSRVPVGTLYRWFPDKSALADALVDRYLDQLVRLYDELLVNDPDEPVGPFVRRVARRIIAEARTQQALPALMAAALVPGGHSRAGTRLRAGLLGHVRTLLDLRIPGLPADVGDRAAEVAVTITHMLLVVTPQATGPDRDVMTDEYIDVLLAYFEAKFPAADHPVWDDPDPTVRPAFPAPQVRDRRPAEPPDGPSVP